MDINKKRRRILFRIVFIAYLVFLMYFLFFSDLFGRTVTYDEYRYNLTPFKEIQRFCTRVKEKDYAVFFVNIVGNIVLFMPFGYLFCSLNERRYKNKKVIMPFIYMFVAASLFCIVVETCQLLSRVGVFDVDDIILNITGAILGFCVYITVRLLKGISRMREYERKAHRPLEKKQKSYG